MFGFKQIPPLFRFAATSDAGLRLATWSVSGGQLPVQRSAEAEAFDAADECSCGLALTGEHAVYNEEAFRYLLDIEQKRFEASAEPYVLVLVQFAPRLGHPERMAMPIAARIFGSLTQTLRDTDVIGWYRDERIIGAVLTHLGDMPLADSTRQMSARVSEALGRDLPEDLARQVAVRLFRPRQRMVR